MSTHDQGLDLLAAALIGVTVGAMATLLFRRGPSGKRPIATGLSAAGHGARWAGMAGMAGARRAGRATARGARQGAERGVALLDELPLEEIKDQIGDYLDAAKDAIEDTITGELQDLRQAMGRQRKRLGI